jgi:PPOX class probable F420-dependent enzyme
METIMPLSQSERDLLDQPAFATLATLMPDGGPQATAIWYRRDGETLRMACGASSVKARNIARDPRVAVTVIDPRNPYAFIQVRGGAEIIPGSDLARTEFRILAQRYMGEADGTAWADNLSPTGDFVVLVVHPERTSMA